MSKEKIGTTISPAFYHLLGNNVNVGDLSPLSELWLIKECLKLTKDVFSEIFYGDTELSVYQECVEYSSTKDKVRRCLHPMTEKKKIKYFVGDRGEQKCLTSLILKSEKISARKFKELRFVITLKGKMSVVEIYGHQKKEGQKEEEKIIQKVTRVVDHWDGIDESFESLILPFMKKKKILEFVLHFALDPIRDWIESIEKKLVDPYKFLKIRRKINFK
jgi:hypothetical protein